MEILSKEEIKNARETCPLKIPGQILPWRHGTWKTICCGSAGVLGQLDEQNMECVYCMYMYFMLKVKTCATYNWGTSVYQIH